MDDFLIEKLRTMEALVQTEPIPLFKPGERVSLTESPFSGIEGVFQIADGERRAIVLIELLSRPVAIHVERSSLRRRTDKPASYALYDTKSFSKP